MKVDRERCWDTTTHSSVALWYSVMLSTALPEVNSISEGQTGINWKESTQLPNMFAQRPLLSHSEVIFCLELG